MKQKFYICNHCGNIIAMIRDKGVPVYCCSEKMQEIVPGTVEASGEKHIPVVTLEAGAVNVNIGAVDHPMGEEHFIEWVELLLPNGQCIRMELTSEVKPEVLFDVPYSPELRARISCNLHGIWMDR